MKKLILISLVLLGVVTITQAANEGIQVHGHWQFDIYNKDGSFDRKVEFENALASAGGDLIARLLAGNNSGGYWSVDILGNNGLCVGSLTCSIYDTSIPFLDPLGGDSFQNLSVTQSGDTLVLVGFIVVSTDNQINSVETSSNLCREIDNPRTCTLANSSNISFTVKNLGSPVIVQAGQTVNVTVTISFS